MAGNGMDTGNHQDLVPYALNQQEIGELTFALDQLESGRGILLRLADIMGGAVGHAVKLGKRGLKLSPVLQGKIEKLAEASIKKAFDIAVLGLASEEKASQRILPEEWRDKMVKAAVVASGTIGGFTGIGGMVPDIGFTTLTLMREIAHIAREEGEDLTQEEARQACLEVFALRSFVNAEPQDDENRLGFFSARMMLRGRPMVLLMADVSYQYGLSFSQKLSMQMMPVVSALCGASLNMAFLNHYRSLARLHFLIRRLEREHGVLAKEKIEHICKIHRLSSKLF